MLFIDPICPKPYSATTLKSEMMGGTEATVIRLVEAMPEVWVMQHNRYYAPVGQPKYRELDWALIPNDQPVIVLRNVNTALETRARGFKGPLYLWLHDLGHMWLALANFRLIDMGIELIAVSHWHAEQVKGVMRNLFGEDVPLPKVHVVYNPISESLAPLDIVPDPNRLVFTSTPLKGLGDVLRHFQVLHARHPELELHVATIDNDNVQIPGVKTMGALTHDQAMQAVAGAFCMFCPNMSYPETFGLVFAEANALGTPAIAHAFGAAPEILDDPRQVVDGYDQAALIARFEDWRENGRPKVSGREAFRLPNIIADWRRLLSS